MDWGLRAYCQQSMYADSNHSITVQVDFDFLLFLVIVWPVICLLLRLSIVCGARTN